MKVIKDDPKGNQGQRCGGRIRVSKLEESDFDVTLYSVLHYTCGGHHIVTEQDVRYVLCISSQARNFCKGLLPSLPLCGRDLSVCVRGVVEC